MNNLNQTLRSPLMSFEKHSTNTPDSNQEESSFHQREADYHFKYIYSCLKEAGYHLDKFKFHFSQLIEECNKNIY